MVYKSIDQRVNDLRLKQKLELGQTSKSVGTKKTRKLMLLDAYCKKQKGLCIICKCVMTKPVLKQNNNSFYVGACCGKEACREAVETNEWFKG